MSPGYVDKSTCTLMLWMNCLYQAYGHLHGISTTSNKDASGDIISGGALAKQLTSLITLNA